jgi:formamidopyrimidine-DNA glycosylase
MPELPEVETIRRDLSRRLIGKRLVGFEVKRPKLIKSPRPLFRRQAIGARIVSVGRRAKVLILTLSTEHALLIHLKMTGQLVYRSASGKLAVGGHPIQDVSGVPNRYTYVTFRFTDGSALYFNDVRMFGYIRLVPVAELPVIFSHLGPEPLLRSFTPGALVERLARRSRTSIKAALLDQTVVAGIGNIYADESLFVARLRPRRRVASLKDLDIRRLYRAIHSVLSSAVAARGTSMASYVDGLGRQGSYWRKRKVYGRAGEKCRRCGTILERTVVAQRGTTYCPGCQR